MIKTKHLSKTFLSSSLNFCLKKKVNRQIKLFSQTLFRLVLNILNVFKRLLYKSVNYYLISINQVSKLKLLLNFIFLC